MVIIPPGLETSTRPTHWDHQGQEEGNRSNALEHGAQRGATTSEEGLGLQPGHYESEVETRFPRLISPFLTS